MKKITLVALATLALIACGRKDSGGDGSASPATSTNTKSGTVNPAGLVDTVSDLGSCDSTHFGELFYVQEISQFFFCSKTNSLWTAVNLQGPKGDSGTQGAQGAAGQNGANGKDAPSLDVNAFDDPITSLRWIVGEYITPTTGAQCPTGSVFPTQTEATSAVLGGMLIKFSSYFTRNSDGIFIVGPDVGGNVAGNFTIMYAWAGYSSQVGQFATVPISSFGQTYYVLCVVH